MLRFLSWPVVVLICACTAITAFCLVPRESGSHEGYLFTLASNLSMAVTIIFEAILDRLRPDFFKQGKALHYRLWLLCTAIGSLSLFLIFRVWPIPVWEVPREILFLSYVSLFVIGFGSAWLITRTKPKSETTTTLSQ